MTATSDQTGLCALCGHTKPLIKSHIFPESMYRSVYSPEMHKFIVISTNTSRSIDLKQKGIREYLLCYDCDSTHIGKYDNYAAQWLYQNIGCTPERRPMSLQCTALNYKMFRFFQLSLLWRFHIARGHHFKNVDLGEHAARIKQMILDEDPGQQYEYPCILVLQPDLFEDLSGGFICPYGFSHKGVPHYRVIAAGLLWIWVLSPDASGHDLASASVSPDGVMHILLGNQTSSNMFKKELIELENASKLQRNADKLGKWGFS